MSDRLARALREAEPPDAEAARERAAAMVAEAYAGRAPRPRRRLALALSPALAVAALVVALTPPGDAVADWVQRIVDPPPARPVVTGSLPTGGRLLVSGPGGTWIVARDGSRRRLGPWTGATWSPRGRFVAAWRGRELAAVDPQGHVRWRVRAPAPVTAARWSPQGFHVVYLAGGTLRVVGGDGEGDAVLRRGVPRRPAQGVRAAPAFRPDARRALAFVSSSGHVEVMDVFTGALLQRSRRPIARGTREIAWSGDGRALTLLGGRRLSIWYVNRDLVRRVRAARRTVVAAAWAPRGRRVAVALDDPSRSATRIARVDPNGRVGRPLFVARGTVRDLLWSPDGRWLLAGWRAADQWLLLRTGGPAVSGVAAVRGVARRFAGSGPTVEGWCCTR